MDKLALRTLPLCERVDLCWLCLVDDRLLMACAACICSSWACGVECVLMSAFPRVKEGWPWYET